MKIVIILNDDGVIENAFSSSNSDVEILIVEKDISNSTNCIVEHKSYVAQHANVTLNRKATDDFYKGSLL